MNIVLLTVDALRFDHLSLYDYSEPTFPELENLSKETAHFKLAYSVSSHTREAVPSLLTGKYPDEAANEDYRLAAKSVADALRDIGFRTGAFHSNPFSSRAYGFGTGFDTFDDDLYLGNSRVVALAQRIWDKLRNDHYVRAEEINRRALSWIDGLKEEPFFLWNHYMDAHGPYEPPADTYEAIHSSSKPDIDVRKLHRRSVRNPSSITSAERAELIKLYDAEVRYLHTHLSEFLGKLRERGLLESSLVIITADHGEGFGENGYYSHPRDLNDDLTHVPLIVDGPGISPGSYNIPVSTLDIVPTILQAATDTVPEEYPGVSIQDTVRNTDRTANRVVFSQARGEGDEGLVRYSARTTDDTMIIEWDTKENTFEVLTDTSDSSLREDILTHASNRNQIMTNPSEPTDLSADVKERLEVLGYRE